MQEIRYKPIGIIHSPFKEAKGMPIQAAGALGVKGTVELFTQFRAGLKNIEGFSHIILIYHFHLSRGYSLEAKPFMDEEKRGVFAMRGPSPRGYSLEAKPFMDEEKRGVFAMRGPSRPNPIGISAVRLVGVEDCTLYIEDVDIIDGTPLLDIKPYVSDFDWRGVERIGWLSGKSGNASQQRSDSRFQSW